MQLDKEFKKLGSILMILGNTACINSEEKAAIALLHRMFKEEDYPEPMIAFLVLSWATCSISHPILWPFLCQNRWTIMTNSKQPSPMVSLRLRKQVFGEITLSSSTILLGFFVAVKKGMTSSLFQQIPRVIQECWWSRTILFILSVILIRKTRNRSCIESVHSFSTHWLMIACEFFCPENVIEVTVAVNEHLKDLEFFLKHFKAWKSPISIDVSYDWCEHGIKVWQDSCWDKIILSLLFIDAMIKSWLINFLLCFST